MKETLIQQCLDILKRDDIKYELKSFCSPLINLILNFINPYIYITLSLVLIIFIMNLAIIILLILILRNKSFFSTK
jgi:hypothetical protein